MRELKGISAKTASIVDQRPHCQASAGISQCREESIGYFERRTVVLENGVGTEQRKRRWARRPCVDRCNTWAKRLRRCDAKRRRYACQRRRRKDESVGLC